MKSREFMLSTTIRSCQPQIVLLILTIVFTGMIVSCQQSSNQATGDKHQNVRPKTEGKVGALQNPMAPDSNAIIQVRLTEFAIEMPATVPAGTTTFSIINQGGVTHSFKIAGEGLERELSTKLTPGELEKIEIKLEPGTYHVYCPVGDHSNYGMSLNLEVGS